MSRRGHGTDGRIAVPSADPTGEPTGEPTEGTGATAGGDLRAPAARRDSRVRRAVAVLLSRFPLITETFILREIDEMERQGQPVRLVPLLREDPEVVHREAVPWMDRALFTPFLSAGIVASNVRMLRRHPGRYLRTLWRVVSGTASSWNLLVRTVALFPKAVHLAERLEEEGIRHLHAHFATHPTTVALIVSELTGLGFSFTAHAHDIFVRRQLLEAKLEAADFVRVISRFNRDFLRDRYPELADRIVVSPVGIDVDAYGPDGDPAPADDDALRSDDDALRSDDDPFRDDPLRHHDAFRDDPLRYHDGGRAGSDEARRRVREARRGDPLLVSVAALEPYKGLGHLVEACGLLRERGLEFRCQIVGTGPLRRPLEDRVRELGLEGRVVLRGPLPQDEVAELLAGARAFVLPSVVADDGQMEGLPVSLMEAMASGCPVITTRLSGIPELVDHGVSGLLVEPGDPARLADALAEVVEDPRLARGLAVEGRRAVAERHRIGTSVARLVEKVDAVNDPAPADLARLLERLSPRQSSPDERSGVDIREWPGSGGPDAVGLRRLTLGADSRVAEIMVVEGDRVRDLVLKTHRSRRGESRAPRLRARREFRLLERLHRQGLEVPAPRCLDEERATILMDSSPGRSLEELLRERRFRPGEDAGVLADACRGAGAWLRRFQELAPAAAVDHEPQAPTRELLEQAAADVERCREAGALAARDGDPVDWLRVLDEGIHPGSRVPVPRHGDFWPGNVFVDDGRVSVVDFEGYRVGLRYEDAAWFLAHVELYLAYPLLGRRRRRLADAFLDGFLAGREFDEALFRLCRTAVALRMLARDLEGGADGTRLARRHRRLLRALVLGD